MYNTQQQVFCLSMLSNRSNAYNGIFTDAAKIAAGTKKDLLAVLSSDTITNQLGNWQLVWGPQVKTSTLIETMVINTMFIAYNAAEKMFVVAIAGTDPDSVKDWIFEDFEVGTLENWTDFVPGALNSGQISKATYDGLNILVEFEDVYVDPFTGEVQNETITASAFLQQYVTAGYSVYVAGHSLGGALSPCYALYLYETWAKAGGVQVYAHPVAGPTPGNDVFAAYYNTLLGGKDVDGNEVTIRVWNVQDVVPQAWVPSLMLTIDSFYLQGPPCTKDVKDAVAIAINKVKNLNYTHLAESGTSFTNINFNASTFLEEVGCQHVCAYPVYFKLTDFQVNVSSVLGITTGPYFSAGGCKVKSQS
jgi:hypothetical protein